jgi:hypothetical protein
MKRARVGNNYFAILITVYAGSCSMMFYFSRSFTVVQGGTQVASRAEGRSGAAAAQHRAANLTFPGAL